MVRALAQLGGIDRVVSPLRRLVQMPPVDKVMRDPAATEHIHQAARLLPADRVKQCCLRLIGISGLR